MKVQERRAYRRGTYVHPGAEILASELKIQLDENALRDRIFSGNTYYID